MTSHCGECLGSSMSTGQVTQVDLYVTMWSTVKPLYWESRLAFPFIYLLWDRRYEFVNNMKLSEPVISYKHYNYILNLILIS